MRTASQPFYKTFICIFTSIIVLSYHPQNLKLGWNFQKMLILLLQGGLCSILVFLSKVYPLRMPKTCPNLWKENGFSPISPSKNDTFAVMLVQLIQGSYRSWKTWKTWKRGLILEKSWKKSWKIWKMRKSHGKGHGKYFSPSTTIFFSQVCLINWMHF